MRGRYRGLRGRRRPPAPPALGPWPLPPGEPLCAVFVTDGKEAVTMTYGTLRIPEAVERPSEWVTTGPKGEAGRCLCIVEELARGEGESVPLLFNGEGAIPISVLFDTAENADALGSRPPRLAVFVPAAQHARWSVPGMVATASPADA